MVKETCCEYGPPGTQSGIWRIFVPGGFGGEVTLVKAGMQI